MKINSYTFSPSKCSLSQLETFLCHFYVQLLFSLYFFYLTCNNSKLKHVWQNHILRDAKLSIAKRHYKENNNTEFFLCQTHLVIQYFKHNEFSNFWHVWCSRILMPFLGEKSSNWNLIKQRIPSIRFWSFDHSTPKVYVYHKIENS